MEAILSGAASFILFHLASHPKSKIHGKIPKAKIKRFELSPRFTFEAKNRIFHLHHWMIFTPIYFFVQAKGAGIFQSDLFSGFLIGGILQGLMYKDSLKLVHRNSEYKNRVSSASYHRFSFLRKIIN